MTINHLYPHDYRAETLSASSATLTHAHIVGAIDLRDSTGKVIRSAKDSIKTSGGTYESLFAKKELSIKGTKVTLVAEANTIVAEDAVLNELKSRNSITLTNSKSHIIQSREGAVTINNTQVKEVDVVTAYGALSLTHVKVNDNAKSLTAGITANDVEAPHLEGLNTIYIANSRVKILTLIISEPNSKVTSIFSKIDELVIINPLKLPVEFHGILPKTITRL